MYFEAELKNEKYKIDVNELNHAWSVRISFEDGRSEHHLINKENYMELDNGISLLFENSSYMVDVTGSGVKYTVYTRGSFREIPIMNDELLLHESLKGNGGMGMSNSLNAGMPGKIVKVFVEPGQELVEKQPILVMEAMKMENEIKASHACRVKSVNVIAGDSVESGACLVTFE